MRSLSERVVLRTNIFLDPQPQVVSQVRSPANALGRRAQRLVNEEDEVDNFEDDEGNNEGGIEDEFGDEDDIIAGIPELN